MTPESQTTAKQREIAGMFDRIARTYDLLNHLFSFGIDRRWRTLAVRRLALAGGHRILDCGAGTGDMSLTAHRLADDVSTVLLDPAQEMLALADSKAAALLPSRYLLVRGVAENLPFPDATFDRFMVAFGIRNFVELQRGMSELYRVLKSGGRGVVLEFTPDRSPLINRIFHWYMSRIMRRAGAAISGDPGAYVYLFRTVSDFATSNQLTELFSRIGFACAANRRLALGIARLFILDKP